MHTPPDGLAWWFTVATSARRSGWSGPSCEAYPEQWSLARWPVKAVMLLLALALPPKLFYRLRHLYSMRKRHSVFAPNRVKSEADTVNVLELAFGP